MNTKEQLIDRWMTDTDFREQVRNDPAGTIANCGLGLSPAEARLLSSFEPGLSDQALSDRISKGSLGGGTGGGPGDDC